MGVFMDDAGNIYVVGSSSESWGNPVRVVFLVVWMDLLPVKPIWRTGLEHFSGWR